MYTFNYPAPKNLIYELLLLHKTSYNHPLLPQNNYTKYLSLPGKPKWSPKCNLKNLTPHTQLQGDLNKAQNYTPSSARKHQNGSQSK